MFKKNIFTVSFIIIILLAIGAWLFYENHGKVDANTWDMIPNDAALIIEVDNPNHVFNNLVNGNAIWQSLLKIHDVEIFQKNILWLDTLLGIKNNYTELFWNSPLSVAYYPNTDSTVELLILSKVSTNVNIDELKRILAQELGREFALLNVAQIPDGFKVVDANNSSTSYFTFIDGVFVYSSSVKLLTKLINTYRGALAKLTDDNEFVKLKQTSGKKVHARAYIQYSKMSQLLLPLVASKHGEAIHMIGDFASWTEVDLLLKENELIFSGFSMSANNETFLSELLGQEPVMVKVYNIIPYNANEFIWLGFSNFTNYFNNNRSESAVKSISANLNIDINKFVKLVRNEVVFVSSAASPGSFDNNSWFIVNTINNKSMAAVLKQISNNTGGKKVTKHNDYEIRSINNQSFIPDIFGKSFKVIKKNYYTFVSDYVVFANTESSLINLINYFETGKTLDLNDNFKDFSDNISSQSNLLVYIKPGQLSGMFSEYLSNDVYKQAVLAGDVINSFQGVVLQVSLDTDLSYTNFYLKHGANYHEENLALWKVQLKDDIVWGPYLVKDHQTKTKNIIVFDKLQYMYLINSDGNVLWSKKLDAIPMSDIFQVDYYKNGKIQYLFSTGNYIYLIDKKGRNVSGFPKKLHSKATNGVVVFDYLNNRDYRLLIAQADKRIYNYSIKGKEVKGWKLPKTQNIVVEPIARLLANKKDYIIITDIENEIKIVNRKGKRRIKLSSNPNKAKNSEYYVNRTNSKGIILTTNNLGKLVYISSSGKLNYTDFGDFSPRHFFLYEDFNGNKLKDFIFVDGKNLKVFDRFKKVLFSYEFGSEITVKPSFFNIGTKQHVLGVVVNDEKTIYLFDKKGNIIISKGLVGETPFTVGDLERNNKLNLISAAGSTLYNYRLN